MEWPELTAEDVTRCNSIVDYRAGLDKLPGGSELRLRIASMGASAGQMLTRYIRHLKVTRIFEIGTCAGIGAAYMCGAAQLNGPGPVHYTGMEGDELKSAVAVVTMRKFCQSTAYKIFPGRFEDSFEPALQHALPLQFVYLDGYHQREPTLHMFGRCVEMMPAGGVIVADDLGWAAQGDARSVMIKHPRVLAHKGFAKKDAFVIGAQ